MSVYFIAIHPVVVETFQKWWSDWLTSLCFTLCQGLNLDGTLLDLRINQEKSSQCKQLHFQNFCQLQHPDKALKKHRYKTQQSLVLTMAFTEWFWRIMVDSTVINWCSEMLNEAPLMFFSSPQLFCGLSFASLTSFHHSFSSEFSRGAPHEDTSSVRGQERHCVLGSRDHNVPPRDQN